MNILIKGGGSKAMYMAFKLLEINVISALFTLRTGVEFIIPLNLIITF